MDNKLDEFIQNIIENGWHNEQNIKAQEIWGQLDYNIRLFTTMYIIKSLCDLIREGGSFRYFIYDMLGFDFDAYMLLFLSGGMMPTNFINEKGEEEDE